MQLHNERVAAPDAAPAQEIWFLHGIYGAGRNWSAIARRLVGERPDWGARLVDLRQHGGSQGMPPPHTLARAAADLDALADSVGAPPAALLGHSFGGKVALAYLRGYGDELEQVWVVDSTPEAGPPGGSAWQMLGVLRELPAVFPTRDAAVQALRAAGLEPPLAQWMATNLELAGGVYRWRFDLNALEELLHDFFRTDLWDVVEDPPGHAAIHFIKAAESSVLTEATCGRLEQAERRTGRVFLHRLPGGHWLNADNPDGVVDLLARDL